MMRRKEPSKGCTLVVKNLTGWVACVAASMRRNTNEAHLREIFRNYGIVKRVRVNRRDGTAISQGIGYVEMSTKEEATTALEYMDGAQIDGCSCDNPSYVGVVVSVGIVYESPFDAKVEHRKRSYSHHRHRSHTRSNSRSHSRSRSRSYSRRDRSRRTHRHSHHRSHYRE